MNLFARSAVFVALFAAGATAHAVTKTNRIDANAEKAHAVSSVPSTVTPFATVTYSGNIAASPTFNRPVADCSGLSATGSAVGYSAQPFTVDVSGSYTLAMTSFPEDGFFVLYSPAFNPASPLTGCVTGDDDTFGDSDPQITTNLTAGTQYVLVSTTFFSGDTGPFTNQITGPGTASFPPSADLSTTIAAPSGVPSSGPFTYAVGVANAGPDAAAGTVVTVTLGTNVAFTGSSCGATASGSTVTWNVGALASGGNATCTLNVTTTGPCTAVNTTASVTSTTIDSDTSNNTAVASNQASPVAEGSFESGTPNPAWTESSDVFGTPLYQDAALANTGEWLVYFGCSNPACPATNEFVEQAVTIPTGATTLTYFLDACGTDGQFSLTIDGTQRDSLVADGSACTDFDNGTPNFVQRTVDLAALGLADGGSHTIRFSGTTTNTAVAGGFLLDDVAIAVPPTCTAPAAADLALSQTSTAVSPVTIGTSFTKTLTVTNNGPGAVTSFTVVDTLPAQLAFVSSTCGATAAGQTVTWTGGAIAFPGSASCTLTVQVVAGGSFSNTAAITASAPADTNPANNTSTGPVVTGSSPSFAQSVPANGTLWLAAMVGLLALSGWFAQRRRA